MKCWDNKRNTLDFTQVGKEPNESCQAYSKMVNKINDRFEYHQQNRNHRQTRNHNIITIKNIMLTKKENELFQRVLMGENQTIRNRTI